MAKKVLFLITSAPYFGKSKEIPSGLWLEELAAPYEIFKNKGYDITFASPKGGPIPLDAGSLRGDFFTEESKKFLLDADAMDMFSHSKKISDLATVDYDCLYVPGGHGCCGDFVSNADVRGAIEGSYRAGKIVAVVCHAPIALVECFKDEDGTKPLVEGLCVTGFSDAEEAAVGQTDNVPYLIETCFKEQGAKYEKAESDWSSHVCVDGNLVTGQNPASSTAAAQKVVELLS